VHANHSRCRSAHAVVLDGRGSTKRVDDDGGREASIPIHTFFNVPIRVQICGWDIIVDTGTRRKDQRECGGPVERTECTARIGYALSDMLCGLLQKKAVLFKLARLVFGANLFFPIKFIWSIPIMLKLKLPVSE
jgi:hypothetical protein